MHLDESGLPVENDPLSSHSSEEKKEVTEDIQAPTEYRSTPAYPEYPGVSRVPRSVAWGAAITHRARAHDTHHNTHAMDAG